VGVEQLRVAGEIVRALLKIIFGPQYVLEVCFIQLAM
jgi:hypothetical protein